MITKQSNILDWPKPALEPAIWDAGSILKPSVKEFILGFISSFAQANNFKDTSAWMTDVKIVGSLTTNCWNSNSDMDIHIVVDLPKFVEVERPEMSEKEASDYLDEIRKQVDQVKAKVPGTEHPTEIYFETEFTAHASQEFSGTYSVLQDAWTKYPHIVDQNFDIEKLHPDLLNLAKETASELDASFGEIKRDVQDIKELNETINDWPVEQRELFEKKLQKRLYELEKDIKGLVDVREDVAEKRKHYKALSEQEVRFKYLQKYFYMHVLTDLKTLLKQSPEFTVKDIPVVENIMAQASLGSAGQYWFDPNGKFYKVDLPAHNHTEWIQQNAGIDSINHAIEKGWIRARKDGDKAVIHLESLQNIPDFIYDFILQLNADITFIEDIHDNYIKVFKEDIIELGVQKAINKALQQKRMQGSLKLAYQEDENRILAIDFDDTLAHENSDHSIGAPMEGAKEALTQLQKDGYTLEIYSHRAETDEGIDEIKEYLSKYEIPYDTILHVDKPIAYRYIDDRALEFKNWKDTLKELI